jgi:hypothetical protein
MSRFSRTPPFSIRLSFEERQRLEALASGQPIGSYVKSVVFNEAAKPAKRRNAAPTKDQEALMQVLALLGQSRLANNLNQLARQANYGSLPVTPDVVAALNRACEDVTFMRRALIKALGLEDGP